jgi:hypothetical protein
MWRQYYIQLLLPAAYIKSKRYNYAKKKKKKKKKL